MQRLAGGKMNFLIINAMMVAQKHRKIIWLKRLNWMQMDMD